MRPRVAPGVLTTRRVPERGTLHIGLVTADACRYSATSTTSVHASRSDRLDLRRADAVVERDPACVVGAEAYDGAVVGHRELRMMVLAMGDISHCVDESHGLVEVGEAKCLADAIFTVVPPGHRRQARRQ